MTRPLPGAPDNVVNALAQKLYAQFQIYVENKPVPPDEAWEKQLREHFASTYQPEEFEIIVQQERAKQEEICRTAQMRCQTEWTHIAWEDLELFEQVVFIVMAGSALGFVRDNLVETLDHIERGNALKQKLLEKLGKDPSKSRPD